MASVPVEIRATLYDLTTKSARPVFLVGEMSHAGLGVGGGPIIPGNGDKPPGLPPGIWPGPGDPDFPGGGRPPGIWGPTDPRPTPPIYIPPMVPPGMKPPEAPEPGSPTTVVPGNWPVAPIAPPEYLIIQYPGIGPVVVAPPAEPQPAPKA